MDNREGKQQISLDGFVQKKSGYTRCNLQYQFLKGKYLEEYMVLNRWSRGSALAFSTQVRGFKPGRSRRIFRAKKSSARLPSEGK